MYCMVIYFEVIYQEILYCQKDLKDNDLSVEMKRCSNGYTGCGLYEFHERGECRPDKLSFKVVSLEKHGYFSKV